jgi:hypothetical protein
MVQVVKRTTDFELFGGLNPGTVRVSTENSKAEVILTRCAILGPATALFRFTHRLQEVILGSIRAN